MLDAMLLSVKFPREGRPASEVAAPPSAAFAGAEPFRPPPSAPMCTFGVKWKIIAERQEGCSVFPSGFSPCQREKNAWSRGHISKGKPIKQKVIRTTRHEFFFPKITPLKPIFLKSEPIFKIY
jgi:hypothetical protein